MGNPTAFRVNLEGSDAIKENPTAYIHSTKIVSSVKRKTSGFLQQPDTKLLKLDPPPLFSDESVEQYLDRVQILHGEDRPKLRVVYSLAESLNKFTDRQEEILADNRSIKERLRSTEKELRSVKEELLTLHKARYLMISTNFLIQFVESIYSKLNTPMPQGQGNANHSTTRVVRAALGITDKMLINAGSKATPATDIHKYQESLNSADKHIAERNRMAHETLHDFAKLLLLPDFVNKMLYWDAAFVFVTGKDIKECAQGAVKETVDLSVIEH